MLQFMPTPLLTPDQVELLRFDNVVPSAASAEGRTLAAFGIEPAAMDAIVPSYLWRFRKTGQFRGDGGVSAPLPGPAYGLAGTTAGYLNSPSPISPSAPTTMRHQANSEKPWLVT